MLQILQMGMVRKGHLEGSQAYHCTNSHIYQPLRNSSSVKNCKNEYDIFL